MEPARHPLRRRPPQGRRGLNANGSRGKAVRVTEVCRAATTPTVSSSLAAPAASRTGAVARRVARPPRANLDGDTRDGIAALGVVGRAALAGIDVLLSPGSAAAAAPEPPRSLALLSPRSPSTPRTPAAEEAAAPQAVAAPETPAVPMTPAAACRRRRRRRRRRPMPVPPPIDFEPEVGGGGGRAASDAPPTAATRS